MITYERPFHADLYYFVLSRIDLGHDAANLYTPPGPLQRLLGREPDWAGPLLDAYRAADGRLTAHALPLIVQDLDELYGWLRRPSGVLGDEPGRALCGGLAEAMRSCQENRRRRFEAERAEAEERRARFREACEPTLDALHDALWAESDRPALRVLDCAPLGDRDFTRGRAVSLADEQRVAVRIGHDLAQAGLQVFHETIHAVTDGEVEASTTRQTRAGTSGYDVHLALERAAVERGQELIADVAPGWLEAYRRWRARWNV